MLPKTFQLRTAATTPLDILFSNVVSGACRIPTRSTCTAKSVTDFDTTGSGRLRDEKQQAVIPDYWLPQWTMEHKKIYVRIAGASLAAGDPIGIRLWANRDGSSECHDQAHLKMSPYWLVSFGCPEGLKV